MFRNLNSLLVVFCLAAVTFSQPASAQDLSGHWSGDWRSCKTSHRGKLSASFCRLDAQHVQANFRGTFAKIIPFRYKAVLNVVHEQPGLMQLSGSKKLGPVMGTFSYDATITGDNFNATYSSRRDRGLWQMRRW